MLLLLLLPLVMVIVDEGLDAVRRDAVEEVKFVWEFDTLVESKVDSSTSSSQSEAAAAAAASAMSD